MFHRLSSDARRHGAIPRETLLCLACAASALLTGCGPNYSKLANEYREKMLLQRGEIDNLKDQVKNKDATIRDLQTRLKGDQPPLQTLPPERLAQVFTAVRMEITPQTDAEDLGKGVKGFRIFIRAYSADGQTLPATGNLTIEAFELPTAPAEPRRIGTWTFTPEEMKKNWYSGLGAYHFAFSCPFQTVPTITNVTFRARLQDALTGQTLVAQLDKKITPPATP